jgi:hypothetical protein
VGGVGWYRLAKCTAAALCGSGERRTANGERRTTYAKDRKKQAQPTIRGSR